MMKNRIFLLAFFLFSMPKICLAIESNVKYGLVKEGAFLLSKSPDTMRDGLIVHSLVGYLPTGTRVTIGNKQTVTNLKTSNDEQYYYIKSELGVEGLIREDLLIHALGRKLGVSIASFNIPLHRKNATLSNSKILLPLGRNGGNYLEIIGETEEGFYDVILHRSKNRPKNYPETESARLKKFYVTRNQVSVLDPNDASIESDFKNSWKSISYAGNKDYDEMIDSIKEKINEDFDAVKSLVLDVSNLQCLIDGSANGELGFKVFSNGFSLNLDANFKKKGLKYIFEGKKLYSTLVTKYYSGIGVVKCDGMKPKRMHSFTLQEGMYSGNKRFTIELSDLKKSKSKWITTLQGSKISTKMVRVNGWEEYNQILKELNDYAISGDGYLSEVPEKTRILLLNYIVSRIGFFEHRDLIVGQI